MSIPSLKMAEKQCRQSQGTTDGEDGFSLINGQQLYCLTRCISGTLNHYQ